MKKLLLLTVLLAFTNILFSQGNGGQSDENNVMRISYIAYFTGPNSNYHRFMIENKLNCPAEIRFEVDSKSFAKDTLLPASSFIYINVPGSSIDILTGKSKRTGKADCIVNPDNGWVEVQSNGIILPLKFNYLKARKLDKSTLEVEFMVYESAGEKEFNIQVSSDGKNFKTVKVVMLNSIEINKPYKTTIKL